MNAWFIGYAREARYVTSLKRLAGWAMGKGLVKDQLRHWTRHWPATSAADNGVIDALLDSVGC